METQEKFLLGALIGGAIGISAALMLTPLSGDRLRKKIIHGLNHSIKEYSPKRTSLNRRASGKVSREIKKAAPKVMKKSSRAKVKSHSRSHH